MTKQDKEMLIGDIGKSSVLSFLFIIIVVTKRATKRTNNNEDYEKNIANNSGHDAGRVVVGAVAAYHRPRQDQGGQDHQGGILPRHGGRLRGVGEIPTRG